MNALAANEQTMALSVQEDVSMLFPSHHEALRLNDSKRDAKRDDALVNTSFRNVETASDMNSWGVQLHDMLFPFHHSDVDSTLRSGWVEHNACDTGGVVSSHRGGTPS